jgi:hypothetical protein
MTSDSTEGEIVKADTLGRVKVSAARREAILDEFEKSGMSGALFAKTIGVKYPTFATWVQKRHQERQENVENAPGHALRLVEAVVTEAASEGSPVVIELPGGARVMLTSPGQIELLCRLLSRLHKMEHLEC